MYVKQRWPRQLIAGFAVMAILVTACNSGTTNKGTVNIAVNPWVGYEANAAVVGYILEKKLGYTVVKKNLAEQVSWDGFTSGEVDMIVENWGHEDLAKIHITDNKDAIDAYNARIADEGLPLARYRSF